MKKFGLMLAFVPLACTSVWASGSQNFLNVYSVSIYGLHVAESRFSSRMVGRDFVINGSLQSAGLGKLFDDTRGSTNVSGYVAAASVVPTRYSMSYRSGRKQSVTEIGFENGRVVKTVNKPEPKRRGRNWVPLDKAHLAQVSDPLTSTLVKAGSLREVCDRTVHVFDGEMRADVKLSYARTRPFSTNGYRGDVVDCKARFVPVAGYRKDNSGISYLQTKSRITISFAPLGDSGVYAPVSAEVGTKIGKVRLYATRFGAAE